MTALTAALVVGCGSARGLAVEVAGAPSPPETNTAPELTPVPTRDAVIKPIEDVLSPTPAPTGAAAAPAPSRADRAASDSMAPDFSLTSARGNEVSLSGLLEDHRAVVLVFYRGYF